MNKIFLISIIYAALFCVTQSPWAKHGPDIERPKALMFDELPLEKSHKEHLLNDRILVFSEVKDHKTSANELGQKWDYKVVGLHPKNCRTALRKISRYERYSEFIGIVKESKYQESSENLTMLLESKLLPFDMRLNFKLARVEKPGLYPFHFPKGFLKGLKGKIHITEHEKRCLFFITSHWSGSQTSIPNGVFEFFTTTLGKMTMEKLFQISKTY